MARLSEATVAKLKAFAQKGGDWKNTGSVIGNTAMPVISMYLNRLKKDDPALHAKFTAVPVAPVAAAEQDDDDEVSIPDEDDDDEVSIVVGDEEPEDDEDDIGDLGGLESDPAETTPAAAATTSKPTVEIPQELPLGLPSKVEELFPKIRLRSPGGQTSELRVFSQSPGKFLVLEIKQKDIRTLVVKGSQVVVDYEEISLNPAGTTQGYRNSDLRVLADLS